MTVSVSAGWSLCRCRPPSESDANNTGWRKKWQLADVSQKGVKYFYCSAATPLICGEMIFTHCKCVLACSVGKFGFSPQIASTFFFSSILCLLAYLLTFFRNPCGPCALSDSIRQSSSFRVIRFLFELPQAVNTHVIKFSLCPYIVVNQQLVTVCTVVQDCCKGRSNKYRKWHFWGSCRPETP